VCDAGHAKRRPLLPVYPSGRVGRSCVHASTKCSFAEDLQDAQLLADDNEASTRCERCTSAICVHPGQEKRPSKRERTQGSVWQPGTCTPEHMRPHTLSNPFSNQHTSPTSCTHTPLPACSAGLLGTIAIVTAPPPPPPPPSHRQAPRTAPPPSHTLRRRPLSRSGKTSPARWSS